MTDNSITCQPPRKEPRELHENHPRVKVVVIYQIKIVHRCIRITGRERLIRTRLIRIST